MPSCKGLVFLDRGLTFELDLRDDRHRKQIVVELRIGGLLAVDGLDILLIIENIAIRNVFAEVMRKMPTGKRLRKDAVSEDTRYTY